MKRGRDNPAPTRMNIALIITLACAFTDWYAVARQNKTLQYFFKPATMVALLLVAFFILQTPHDAWQARWFIVGFFFSLLADIFLMLSNPRGFLFGLGAFLLAHVCYIIGLNPTVPPFAAFVLLIPCALIVGLVLWRVLASLRASNHSSLAAPVLAYGLAMTLMLFSAWATLFRADWNETRRAFVIVGATLFFISDAMLAWNRFVKSFHAAKLGVIITYHLAQIALALSIQT